MLHCKRITSYFNLACHLAFVLDDDKEPMLIIGIALLNTGRPLAFIA